MKTKPEKINSVQDLIDYLEFVCEQIDLETRRNQYYLLLKYDCEYGLCALCRFINFKNPSEFTVFIYDYLKGVFKLNYINEISISDSDSRQDAIQLRIDWLKENQDKIETSFKKYLSNDTEN